MKSFTQIERLAFWNVYSGKCVYCSNPILRISEMHIDHIFPDNLKNDLDSFNKVKEDFDLPKDFELDKYYNLICSCSSCNRAKSDKIRERSAMLTYYSIAKENEPKIIASIKESKNILKSSELLTQLRIIIEQGFLEPKEVLELFNISESLILQINNPIVITLTQYDEEARDEYLFSNQKEYWQWCDKCLDEIISLIKENLRCIFTICDESRDGEGYGVRFAFWGLNLRDFNEKFIPSIKEWEIQEVLPFDNIYGESAKDLFFKLA